MQNIHSLPTLDKSFIQTKVLKTVKGREYTAVEYSVERLLEEFAKLVLTSR